MQKSYFETHPIAKVGFFVIPLLIFIFLMEKHFPTMAPEGYKSFIIAFEFAKTPEQIHQLLKDLSPSIIQRINTGNYIDFGFMLTYVLFLIFLLRALSKAFSQKWILIGIPICIIILLADIYENVLLLQITSRYSSVVTDVELNSILKILHKITWVKWGGLSVIFTLIATELLKKNLRTSIQGMVCIIPILIGFFALSNNPKIVTWFTFSIFIVFFILIFFSFTYKKEE